MFHYTTFVTRFYVQALSFFVTEEFSIGKLNYLLFARWYLE